MRYDNAGGKASSRCEVMYVAEIRLINFVGNSKSNWCRNHRKQILPMNLLTHAVT